MSKEVCPVRPAIRQQRKSELMCIHVIAAPIPNTDTYDLGHFEQIPDSARIAIHDYFRFSSPTKGYGFFWHEFMNVISLLCFSRRCFLSIYYWLHRPKMSSPFASILCSC